MNNMLSFAGQSPCSCSLKPSVMLGRRQYRIKILQSLYAYFQGGEPRVEIAEKNLFQSIEKTVELYYLFFSALLEFIDFYEVRTEEARHKFYPTEEEKNPNTRLLANAIVRTLRENREIKRADERYKFNWADDQELFRKIFIKIRDSKELRDYLESTGDTHETDRDFITRLFRKFILRSADLQFYCEERSIYWADDYDWAALFVMKTLKSIPPGFPAEGKLISLLEREEDEDPSDDQRFIRDLFTKTILHSDEFSALISERTRNWELDRIALTDIILLKMALAELLFFPSIPVKVTFNEYIEISKHFSSAKSKLFINGILDKLVSDLREQGRITKTGRGLLDK